MAHPKGVRPFDRSTVRRFQEGQGDGTAERPTRRPAEQATVAGLAARAALARGLALAFAPPQGSAGEFLLTRLPRKLLEAAEVLGEGPGLETAAEALARSGADGAGLTAEHQRLFRTAMAATPYETEYGPQTAARKGPALADLLGFYEAFGFRPAPGAAELPDHIGAELEFLSLLLVKEADARGRCAAEEAAVAADAARKFFADHLAAWAPAFCRRLGEAAAHPFYRAAADLLRAFLEGEAGRTGVGLGDEAGPAEPGSPAGCAICPMASAPAAEGA